MAVGPMLAGGCSAKADRIQQAVLFDGPGKLKQTRGSAEFEKPVEVEAIAMVARKASLVGRDEKGSPLPERGGLDLDEAGLAIQVERPNVVAQAIAFVQGSMLNLVCELANPQLHQPPALESQRENLAGMP